MAKIFLTGATGFVGSFVAQKLIEQEHQVTCLVRKTSNLRWIEQLPLEYCTGSLYQPESYKDAVKTADYILHIAGVTKALNRDEYYRGNVVATKNMLDTVVRENPKIKRFLLVSSQAAVGPSPGPEPIDETVPMNPLTDYGKSKMEAEHVTRTYMDKIPITIVRPPAVYGPRDMDVLNFFKNMKWRINLQVGNVDQLVSLIYVEDLAEGIIRAALSPNSTGETYFLCEEPPYRWSQFARITAQIMEKKYITVRVPYFLAFGMATLLEIISQIRKKPTILNRQKMREIKQPYWAISCQKAKNDFGFRTNVPLPEGIKRTVDWYQQEGWL